MKNPSLARRRVSLADHHISNRLIDSATGHRPPSILPRRLRQVLLALAFIVLVHPSIAATYTWTGAGFIGDTDFKWSNPFNWQGLVAPQDGEQNVQLVFPNSSAPRSTTNDVLNLVISSVLFQGDNYGIHGGPGGITMTLMGSGGTAFNVVAAADNCQFGPGTRLHLGAAGNVLVATGSTLAIKSRISGVPGFTKFSPGTLSLESTLANTFFGTVTVLEGLLELRTQGVSIPGPIVIGDGNGNYNPVVRLAADHQIGDSSAILVRSNGRLFLNGFDDTIGSLTLERGAWVNTAIGSSQFSPGLLSLAGNVTNLATGGFAAKISGQLDLGPFSRTFHVEGRLEIPAVISGSPILNPGFTKTGPGWLELSGAVNTYTGHTYVQEGTLGLTGPIASLGATNSGTTVSPDALVAMDNVHIGNEPLTLNGLADEGILRFHGTNEWAGPVTLNGDCLVFNLDVQPIPDAVITFSGAISGSGALRKRGRGKIRFTGFAGNVFTGGFHAEEGFVDFDKSASAPALSGPLVVGRAGEIGQWTFVEVQQLNQIPNNVPISLLDYGMLTVGPGATDTLGDVEITGGGLFTMGGVFTLAGNITNRLSTNNVGALYGNMFLSAAEHVFHCDSSSLLEVNSALMGSGSVTKSGPGLMTFFNTNSYAGATVVKDGSLRLAQNGRPGSSAAGTSVHGLAILQLFGVGVTNETLTLEPFSIYQPRIDVAGTNLWKGPVILNANSRIETYYSPHLVIDGPISGPGGIVYKGSYQHVQDGTLVLQGATANTYLGDTIIEAGTLVLKKQGAAAIPGNLVLGLPADGSPPASAVCASANQFAPADALMLLSRTVTIHPSGALHGGGFEQSIANLDLHGGGVFTEGGVLKLQRSLRCKWVAGNETSHFFGELRLSSPYDNEKHLFDIEAGAGLQIFGDISQGAFAAGVEKRGKGEFAMISDNSFDGEFLVEEGIVLAAGSRPFGTEAGRTIVQSGATLHVFSGTNAEPFTLSGAGFDQQGALVVHGSHYFTGPILLASSADVVTPANTNLAEFSGPVSGPGGLTKMGAGTLRIAGSADNTYTNATRVFGGVLDLTKTNSVAVPGALQIGLGSTNAVVRLFNGSQIGDQSAVVISDGGQFHTLGNTESIGSLSGSGIVALLGGALFTGNDNTATTYSGLISGIGGSLTKTGTNTFTLTGNNAYTGTTFVKGGTLLVRGQQPQSPVTIQTGGTLAGDGSVGAISDLSGHVQPGTAGYGILKSAGFITHSPANQLRLRINGSTPGLDCDQLDVTGSVTLMGGRLDVGMLTAGAAGKEYVIVRNDGSDPVNGTFIGLPENAFLTNNGVVLQISYQAGDGNDVALIQQAASGPRLGSIQKLSDGSIQFTAEGMPNATYRVETTDDLSPPVQWIGIGAATADSTGQVEFTDADAPKYPVRFYRFMQP